MKQFHPKSFDGDCRDDANRFAVDDATTQEKEAGKMTDFFFKEIEVFNADKTTKVVLHWDCFEGIDGDYNANDLSDKPLLRFDIYSQNPAYTDEGNHGWRIPDSSSYCTGMDARKDRRLLTAAAKGILEAVDEYCQRGASIKKICEDLSWWE